MDLKNVALYLALMIATVILVSILALVILFSCDEYREVCLDAHDLNTFVLSELASLEVTITCLLFGILILSRVSPSIGIVFALVWMIMFHILFHVYVLRHIDQTSDPTTAEIVRAYDAELRVAEDNTIVPTWLAYVYDKWKCCGFYDNEEEGPNLAESQSHYIKSIDATLKKLSCSSLDNGRLAKVAEKTNKSVDEGMLEFFRFHPQPGDVGRFQVDYEQQEESSEGASPKAAGGSENPTLGCASAIRKVYEECVLTCFHCVIANFIAGFIPFVSLVLFLKAERKRRIAREKAAAAEREQQPQLFPVLNDGGAGEFESLPRCNNME